MVELKIYNTQKTNKEQRLVKCCVWKFEWFSKHCAIKIWTTLHYNILKWCNDSVIFLWKWIAASSFSWFRCGNLNPLMDSSCKQVAKICWFSCWKLWVGTPSSDSRLACVLKTNAYQVCVKRSQCIILSRLNWCVLWKHAVCCAVSWGGKLLLIF